MYIFCRRKLRVGFIPIGQSHMYHSTAYSVQPRYDFGLLR